MLIKINRENFKKTDLNGDLGMDERLITNSLLEKFGVELYLVQLVGCCESVCELCGSITTKL
jgi:hypothetical protein